MREIKFRAWSKKRNKMYEVLVLLKDVMSGLWAKCRGYSIIEQKDIQIDVQPKDCIIMQYTGLKDKNGKEIYEGDVVSILDITTRKKPYIGDVRWVNEVTGFEAYSPERLGGMFLHNPTSSKDTHISVELAFYIGKSLDRSIEVIGNIHEHPDLLKKVS